MRRVYLLILVITLFAIVAIPLKVSGQGVHTLNPPINRVELNSQELLPPGAVAQLGYAAPATQGGSNTVSAVQWIQPQPAFATPFDSSNISEACGYPDGSPAAILTYPDGHQNSLQGRPVTSGNAGCWTFDIGASYGMQLGTYTLTLNSGELARTWQIDYANVPTSESYNFKGERWYLLMGFIPSQIVQVDFYSGRDFYSGISSGSTGNSFIARRNFQADANGAFVIEIVMSRTSPFAGTPIQILYVGQNVASPTVSPPTASSIGSGDCPDFTVPSRLQIGGQARVLPGDPNLVNSDPSRLSEHKATRLGAIPPGGVMTIEDGPTCDGDILFWKVNYNGLEGWTGEGQGNQYWLEPVQ